VKQFVVLVTGVPGSGKTTLGREVARAVGVPLFSLDVVKEAIFDSVDVQNENSGMRLREAGLSVITALIPDCPLGAIVDLWVDPRRDRTTVRRVFEKVEARPILEIVCDVPGEVAVERYASRRRHAAHKPPDTATLDRIRDAARILTPLEIGPALRLDTSGPVDLASVIQWVRTQTGRL
jgi:predicted kinase